MQRGMNAKLQFNEKPVQHRVHVRVRQRRDGPYAAPLRFLKLDVGRWTGKAMVTDSEAHGLAKIHAAEDRKSVHAISRDVKSQTCAIGKAWLVREPACVAIALEDLVERDARLGRRNIVFR